MPHLNAYSRRTHGGAKQSIPHDIKHLLIFWFHGPYPQFDITNRKPKAESNISNLLANATNLLDLVVSTHQSWINTKSMKKHWNHHCHSHYLSLFRVKPWFFSMLQAAENFSTFSSLVKWWFQTSRTCWGDWIYTCARCTAYVLIVCDTHREIFY